MAATGNNSWKNYSANYASTGQEIKSHSSVLFNERLNALFMMYDTEVIDLDIKPDVKKILRARSLLSTIWRNVRPIISNNPKARHIMSMNTKHDGVYTPDMGFSHIQECIAEMVIQNDYAYPKLMYTIQQIQNIETIIREVMQFFSYFIRQDSSQKPDINVASQKYQKMADEKTVEEFRDTLGDRTQIADESHEKPVGDEFFDDMSDYLLSDKSQDEDDIKFANDTHGETK